MLSLTDENFEKEIAGSKRPVLVDFYAVWCSPCAVFTPVLEKAAEEFKDRIIFTKANLDELPLAGQKYGIDRIPTLIFFREGKSISQVVGVRTEAEIKEWLNNLLM